MMESVCRCFEAYVMVMISVDECSSRCEWNAVMRSGIALVSIKRC